MNVITQEEFASPDGIPLCFDLYHPGVSNAPVIVYLHGGGWISGERSMYSEEAEWAAENGYAGVVVDYRLAPLYPFPAAVLDARAAVGFLRENAGRLDIDSSKIAAFGNSAGGHLATMMGVCRSTLDGSGEFDPVTAVIDVCGITDIRNPSETQFPISMSFVEQFLGGGYHGREEVYAAASPISHVDRKCCPFLIVHGADDEVVPVSQSRTLVDALREHGGGVEYVELEGEGHSFSFEAWDKVRESALKFLAGAL